MVNCCVNFGLGLGSFPPLIPSLSGGANPTKPFSQRWAATKQFPLYCLEMYLFIERTTFWEMPDDAPPHINSTSEMTGLLLHALIDV